MSYEKQNWVPYDDNLSEEENINVGAVVTAERMNHIESGIQQHTTDEENPHKVTKAQVGLSNVTDVEQASKVDFEAHATNNLNPHGVTASQVGLGNVENIRQAAKTDFDAHVENSSNPHGVTAKQVGLENVMNYDIASDDEAKAGQVDNKYMTPAKVSKQIEHLEVKTEFVRIDTFNSDGTYFNGTTFVSFSNYWESMKKMILIFGGYQVGGGGRPYGYRVLEYDKNTIERLDNVKISEPMVSPNNDVHPVKAYTFTLSNKRLTGDDPNQTGDNRNQTLKEIWVERYL